MLDQPMREVLRQYLLKTRFKDSKERQAVLFEIMVLLQESPEYSRLFVPTLLSEMTKKKRSLM